MRIAERNLRPKAGDRIFRNMTMDEATVMAQKSCERMNLKVIDYQLRLLANEFWNYGQAPFLHTITEEEAEKWN